MILIQVIRCMTTNKLDLNNQTVVQRRLMDIQPIRNISLKNKIRNSLKVIIQQVEESNTKQLPGEHELASRLGITRISLRDVLKDFEHEGIIYKIQGKGTFINTNALKMKVTLSPAVEFGQAIEKSGYKSTVDLVEVVIGSSEEGICHNLHLQPDAVTVCLKKIFYADGKPVIYCEDVFAKDLIKGDFLEHELEQSTFEYLLTKAGIIVTHDILEIIAANSSDLPEQRQLYHMADSKPLLLLQSVYYTAKNKPVMFVKAYFDTEYIKLNILRRQDVYSIE